MGLPFEPDSSPPSSPQSQHPPVELLADIYRLIPSVVFVTTTDGIVLYINAAAEKATGYTQSELAGKNLWAILFPGRLFAQIPKFISLVRPNAILNDHPLTLRTKDGRERTIAFSRSICETPAAPPHSTRTILCIGTDLTDRLTDAELKAAQSNISPGDAGAIDSDVVTPIAISPPIPPSGMDPSSARLAAVVQVHDFLMQIDDRVNDLQIAFAQGQIGAIAQIATTLHEGAHACGLLDFASRTHHLQSAATHHALDQVTLLVQQVVDMARGKKN